MNDHEPPGKDNHDMLVTSEDTGIDTIVWEQPTRVSNRTFPGPGLLIRVLRRGDTASFTFSPDLVQAVGLTDGCRVIFGWDPKNRRLGIMRGYGSKIRVLRSGNAEVSKAMSQAVLNDLLGHKVVMFFTPVIVPGPQIMVISQVTAHDPWATAGSVDQVAQLPLLRDDTSPEPAENAAPRALVQGAKKLSNLGNRHPVGT